MSTVPTRPSRLGAVARLLGAALTLRLTRYEIAEKSMEPTLRPGDWVVGARRPRRVRTGDVVVVEIRPGFDVVKRVADPPPGSAGLWLLGDNRDAPSMDSRSLGPVEPARVRARLLARYHPRPMRIV
jgi:signal peptidase I